MKDNQRKEEEGFHVICGTSPKNGISGYIGGDGVIAGDITKSEGVLDLTGLNSLLIVDLEYFVEYKEEILEMVKEQIEKRGYLREHPKDLEEAIKGQQKQC